jgi:UDP-N-acetyl-D-mannosaminuronic acid dehydrogenase
MVKLIENSSRDVEIAFANTVAAMCDAAGIDPFDAIELANKHPRVKILQPGCGVGGHCIAVDPWFLIKQFEKETKLMQAAREVNNNKPKIIIKKVIECSKKFFQNHNQIPKVLALGLTFKPNVDDTRESPALQIVKTLKKEQTQLRLTTYDPFISQDILLDKEIKNADIILFLVKHNQFMRLQEKIFMSKIIINPCGLKFGEKSETVISRKRESNASSCTNTPA